MTPSISVRKLFGARELALQLELLTTNVSLEGRIANSDVSSPGLSLAGYTARFPEGRALVFGATEVSYLATLGHAEVEDRLGAVFAHDVPAVFITRGQDIPRLTIPLNSGKSLTIISEVIAMNQLLVYAGVDVPSRFDDGLRDAMNPRDSLIEDYE